MAKKSFHKNTRDSGTTALLFFFVFFFFFNWDPVQGMELQEKEAQKHKKRNLFRKNLQLIGVC